MYVFECLCFTAVVTLFFGLAAAAAECCDCFTSQSCCGLDCSILLG